MFRTCLHSCVFRWVREALRRIVSSWFSRWFFLSSNTRESGAGLHFPLNIRYSDPRFWMKGKNNLKKRVRSFEIWENQSRMCALRGEPANGLWLLSAAWIRPTFLATDLNTLRPVNENDLRVFKRQGNPDDVDMRCDEVQSDLKPWECFASGSFPFFLASCNSSTFL